MEERKTAAPRRLDTDENGDFKPFKTASGATYRAIGTGKPIGLRRWTEYEKLKIVLGFGRTFSALVDALNAMQSAWADDRPAREIRRTAIIEIESMKRAILEMSKERYSIAFYMVTLFVVRDGDDALKWDIEKANEYLADWEAEGLDEQQLFFFALNKVSGYKAVFDGLRAEAEAESGRLSGLSTLTGMGKKQP